MKLSILKNFLDKVIIRVDFLSKAGCLDETIPDKLKLSIMEVFPIDEPRELLAEQYQFHAKEGRRNIKHASTKINEWNYHGREREKTLTITKNYFYIVYKNYQSFSKLKDELKIVLDFLTDQGIQYKQIGLRYINVISDEDTSNIFSWDTFQLNESLTSMLQAASKPDMKKISRAFNILELNYDDFNLRFQYGMFNPDFPAPIKKKLFTLDFDAHYQGVFSDNNDLNSMLERLHDAIKKLVKQC